MKAFLLLILLSPSAMIAQTNSSEIIAQLETLYAEHATLADKSLTYDDGLHVLHVSGYVIGVQSETLVRGEGKEVVFLCQEGTQIIHRDKPGEPRAQLKLPMANKKSAKRFAKLFTSLVQAS